MKRKIKFFLPLLIADGLFAQVANITRNQLNLPLLSAWRCPCKRTQRGVSSASQRHSSPVTTRCKCSSSFCSKPAEKATVKTIEINEPKKGFNVHFGNWHALMGGLVSTGAPSAPPARLFFRFSWTWVSRSSRSTLSASLARQASSSWFARLVREDLLLSTSQKHKKTHTHKMI